MEDFGFERLEKGQILRLFSGVAPLKLHNLSVGYVYIENSFDTIFNIGYGSVKSHIG